MDKLTKYTERFCEDCQLWIQVKNCRECLFNVFRRFDKYPPFSWEEKDNGKSDKKS